MDHKTWLWRKKSSEKTIVVGDKLTPPSIGNKDEIPETDKEVAWENSVKNLNDKLSSALFECNAKDDLVIKHAKVAEEALAGWEKADSEVATLKLQLDEAIRQRLAAEEQINHLDASLKECTQQLHFVREEQGLRINDAIVKASKEHEKAKLVFEEKLAESGKKLVKLGVENTHRSKILQEKEKLIEDLSARVAQAEIDFNGLTARLDTVEKDNTSLKYELRVLEKELEVRNEEREFNRRSADASHKQHLESVKKIAKLESECQRLRILVRKRLPGPAALAKMKNEVEILGRESNENRRTKLHPPVGALTVNDPMQDNHHLDSPSKRVNYLLERLCDVEQENKNMRDTLAKKIEELESSKTMYEHTAAKLSEVEAQLSELSKSQTNMVLYDEGNSTSNRNEHNEESEKWASALISQLEHFRNGKSRGALSCNVGGSDMSLMDDFVEMEKLAIVCMDNEDPNNYRNNTCSEPLQTEPAVSASEVAGKELVPVCDGHSGVSDPGNELKTRNGSAGKYRSWLQDVLRIILEQNRITHRSSDEIMEEIRAALIQMFGPIDVLSSAKKPSLSGESDVQHISGYITWGPPDASPVDSDKSASESNTFLEEVNTVRLQTSLRESISKMVKLIEGVSKAPLSYNGQQKSFEIQGTQMISEMSSGHTVRVFQWKSSELNSVLQQFVDTCTDLLNGKADFEKFAQVLATAFDWIMNHCFKLDSSSTKDATKKHSDWDKSQDESECGIGIHPSSQMEAIQTTHFEENVKIKDELMKVITTKKGLEDLQSSVVKIDALMNQLQESGRTIGNLQSELETMRELNQMTEDQIETQKLLTEDLNNQLTVARIELNEARQKFSSLEVELEDKTNSCQELEATCLELQLQLESVTKDAPKYNGEQEGRQHKSDWEIAAASEKLAECQETILNLGKQLKALASPREAALLDKVISVTPSSETPSNKHRNNGSSLLDQMLAEDGAVAEDLASPKMKEIICTTDSQKPPTLPSQNRSDVPAVNTFNATAKYLDTISPRVTKYRSESAGVGTLAIVPSKRRGFGGGLLRKLLMRRKRANNKKIALPMVAY